MRKAFTIVIGLIAILAYAGPSRAGDDRELVKMPAMMQEHMLASMRDHLLTVGEITADLAAEKYDAAGKVAEERLGLSSFDLHGASHMAPYMPKPMQEAGTSLHKAASRFALAAADADVDPSYESMKKLHIALNDMLSACNACHSGYRIR